jgi:UDP-N-acetylmuramoyl-tripeptide--D-alanyl-D-alanine ligase
MMTIESYILFASLALVVFYTATRLLYQLQMMQQNSYRVKRYWRWLRSNAGTESLDVTTDMLMAVILTAFWNSRWAIYAAGAVGLISLYKGVRRLRTKYKKPLVFTARAVRIYLVGLLIVLTVALAAVLWAGGVKGAMVATITMAVTSPLVVCLAVVLLRPVELAVTRWYIADARRILRSMPHLKIIGITGSYGKTSTKHYLHRILSERFSTVMTPGSYNTTLGVVRTIREQLKPYTEVFIVEMGAKQAGDIAEICDLVHPSIGIITAIGVQHLESFKTVENIQHTKFELIKALEDKPNSIAILNNNSKYVADRHVSEAGKVFRYTSGGDKAGDYRVTDINYGYPETTFRIENPEGGESQPFTTKLIGKYNLLNLLAAYIAGRELGMTENELHYVIPTIEQVEHRLSINRTPGGVTIIDDAFNSNPVGAAMALDVLANFTDGKRIVVTPGMIEGGKKQDQLNYIGGWRMASRCDYAVIVGKYNRDAILLGLAKGEFDTKNIYMAKDLDDASRHLATLLRAGDVILYENDLPDTFK